MSSLGSQQGPEPQNQMTVRDGGSKKQESSTRHGICADPQSRPKWPCLLLREMVI